MRFRREMHDSFDFRHQAFHKLAVGDVALREAVIGLMLDIAQILRIARVS